MPRITNREWVWHTYKTPRFTILGTVPVMGAVYATCFVKGSVREIGGVDFMTDKTFKVWHTRKKPRVVVTVFEALSILIGWELPPPPSYIIENFQACERV